MQKASPIDCMSLGQRAPVFPALLDSTSLELGCAPMHRTISTTSAATLLLPRGSALRELLVVVSKFIARAALLLPSLVLSEVFGNRKVEGGLPFLTRGCNHR